MDGGTGGEEGGRRGLWWVGGLGGRRSITALRHSQISETEKSCFQVEGEKKNDHFPAPQSGLLFQSHLPEGREGDAMGIFHAARGWEPPEPCGLVPSLQSTKGAGFLGGRDFPSISPISG